MAHQTFSSFSDEHIPPQYKTVLIAFMVQYWGVMARLAVQQYNQHGRSVMIVTINSENVQTTGLSLEKAISFFDDAVLAGANQGEDSLPIMHNVIKLIQTYNPTKEMVLWFGFPGDNEVYCKVDLKDTDFNTNG